MNLKKKIETKLKKEFPDFEVALKLSRHKKRTYLLYINEVNTFIEVSIPKINERNSHTRIVMMERAISDGLFRLTEEYISLK